MKSINQWTSSYYIALADSMQLGWYLQAASKVMMIWRLFMLDASSMSDLMLLTCRIPLIGSFDSFHAVFGKPPKTLFYFNMVNSIQACNFKPSVIRITCNIRFYHYYDYKRALTKRPQRGWMTSYLGLMEDLFEFSQRNPYIRCDIGSRTRPNDPTKQVQDQKQRCSWSSSAREKQDIIPHSKRLRRGSSVWLINHQAYSHI